MASGGRGGFGTLPGICHKLYIIFHILHIIMYYISYGKGWHRLLFCWFLGPMDSRGLAIGLLRLVLVLLLMIYSPVYTTLPSFLGYPRATRLYVRSFDPGSYKVMHGFIFGIHHPSQG